MDRLMNYQLSRLVEEYHVINEVRNCIESMLFQLEMNAKDEIITKQQKEILQLKQEGRVLEEANTRYSQLQLVEASESNLLRQSIQKEMQGIQRELLRTKLLEKEVIECKAEMKAMKEENDKTRQEVEIKTNEISEMQKQMRKLRLVHMNILAPCSTVIPKSIGDLPHDAFLLVLSYLGKIDNEVSSALNPIINNHINTKEDERKNGIDTAYFHLNSVIGDLREQVYELSQRINDLTEDISDKDDRIEELEVELSENQLETMKIRNELDSAMNQMASDKEVKYYLDENYGRVSQELREREEQIQNIKSEFSYALKQKDQLLNESRKKLLAAVKDKQ